MRKAIMTGVYLYTLQPNSKHRGYKSYINHYLGNTLRVALIAFLQWC